VELKAFNYSVSHDLRAPLLVIGGFSRKLLEKYSSQLDVKGQQFLDTIYRNTQNMQQLIDDLLAFSNLDNRKMKVSEVNMGDLAKAVFEELRDFDPERTLILKTLPQVRGDKAMIRQVFVNLLSNAFKFTKPKGNGVIEIGSMTEENKAVYYVRDNGIGFDMQDANKLFNVFQRLHSPDAFEGTGVGLAIVKRIVSRHGGWVWAEGRVNEGATFYFSLPMEKPVVPKETKAPEEKTANET
jgi:light-regulated signal transduction histidine kinase (bacteriophytochrome)